ncbi:hypothetical protein D3C59_18065 [Streptomyces sp. SHP22-7]|nr:hypothetical protein D3C59_18065 [Streptomyces sp. SHP22-7]
MLAAIVLVAQTGCTWRAADAHHTLFVIMAAAAWAAVGASVVGVQVITGGGVLLGLLIVGATSAGAGRVQGAGAASCVGVLTRLPCPHRHLLAMPVDPQRDLRLRGRVTPWLAV